MEKWIMILGAGFDQLMIIKTAKSMGLKVVVVDRDKDAPGFRMCDESHNVDIMDFDKVLNISREKKISGITTMVSNLGMRTVAYVAEKMNLPSIPPKAAQAATDKKTIKKLLKEGGVPIPEGFSASSYEEALDRLHKVHFPVIVKPVDGTKGRGINAASAEGELQYGIDQALKYSPAGNVIVEEWIDGPTVGAECLIIDGILEPIIITDKYNTPPPKCVTVGLNAPARLSDPVRKRVKDTARKVAEVLGLNTGAAHIDMIVDNNDVPRVIDVGPRLASGPVIFDFVPNLLGVNMIQAVIQMAIGEKPQIEKIWNGKYAASRFLTVSEKGYMYRIEIPKTQRGFTFYQFKELGEVVRPPLSDTDRIGCITIKEDSYEKVVKDADKLLDAIKVSVVY